MTIQNVSSAAQLATALTTAAAGDTILLAAGQYGDLAITRKTYASDLTIKSADVGHPAEFNSITVLLSAGIHFDGVNVNLAPTAATTTTSSVVRISNSSQVSFTGGLVHAGLPVNGVSQTATALDSTGNVIGMPTARGFTVEYSSGVLVQGVEITQVFRGMVLSSSDHVTVRGNTIHDVRTSTIVGGDVDHIVVDGNHLFGSHPWNTGAGDHADFVHFWTAPGSQTIASTDIVITNNVLDMADGVPPLGIYLDDNGNHLGFDHVTITNNLILNGVGQGMRLENVSESTVTGNVLLQAGPVTNHTPGIVTDGSAATLDIFGNITAFANNNPNSSANVHDNTLVQNTKPTGSFYYSPATVLQASAMADPTAVKLMLMQGVMVDSAIQGVLRLDVSATSVAAMATSLKAGLSGGTITADKMAADVVHAAAATASVATLSYEFFTGKAPSAGGMDFLVATSGGNKSNLNSAYYQSFSVENRYINFAVNLGKVGEGAAAFAAKYGSMDLYAATRSAYETIFGAAPSDAKLHDLLDATITIAGHTVTRTAYFASYGLDGAGGIGTKAAMVGWLLAEAVKADIGVYALSNDAFLTDVALHNAPFAVDIVGAYGRPEYVYHPG